MSLRVTRCDGLVTLQDAGRPGWAHLGVPRAGALDAPEAMLANRLLGNDPAAALLETTLAGVGLVTTTALTFAVAGADCAVTTDGRARPLREPVTVAAGVTIELGPTRAGVRSYLAVAGGVAADPVLGSRSTDTLAWVGPPRVASGQLLPVGPARGRVAVDVSHGRRRDPVLRVLPGPRMDWFGDDALDVLTRAPYVVQPASNRIGLRLSGARLSRVRRDELPSEGLVLGAVQVPPDGQPVVFLHDHPVTGGYPVLAVVHPDDLAVCAQARPGERLSLRRWEAATA